MLAQTNSSSTTTITKGANITKPGCQRQCGNLRVPYPFGIGRGCAIDTSFEVNFNTSFNPFKTFFDDIEISEISDSQMRVSNVVAHTCHNESGAQDHEFTAWTDLWNTPYSYSELNKFTVIGHDNFTLITGFEGRNFTSGCLSVCSKAGSVLDGYCSGSGCCQTLIPRGFKYYFISLDTVNLTQVSLFNTCSYAFLGEQDRFVFHGASDMSDHDFVHRTSATVPIVPDWAIGNLSCSAA
ncbi:hypothetical protein ACH5RR_005001 [Cinchona calisaya]|uniref:Uncharacterized protein n=1 Tax=Cinchona calisaya TaxID=153742 RepID=A0ABD3AZL9_9GENT